MTRPLPYWPRNVKVEKASAYFDESEGTFRDRVDKGLYPAPIRIGGNVYCLREVPAGLHT